ncbi:MAG: 5'/3'-nucleotidase SurE [Synergistaceae bacterium]|jgi:5'-nucleotidase|nr:5'/3'-nucleotidase SurE [Synergistaceae bacterium]
MRILLSNDDGVRARGIVLLANLLAGLGHEMTVVAPDRERSAAGHSITTSTLYLDEKSFPGYDARARTFECSGTPADCAALGVGIAAPDAELVLAGINRGPNLGCDVFYSGTVAAAREGYFEGRPAIALSLAVNRGVQEGEEHYGAALHAVQVLLENLDALFGPPGGPSGERGKRTAALLNVNIPNMPLPEVKGFKVTFAGRRRYQDRVQRLQMLGRTAYRLMGAAADQEEAEGSDVRAVNEGFIALTFLQHDTTDYTLNSTAGMGVLPWP